MLKQRAVPNLLWFLRSWSSHRCRLCPVDYCWTNFELSHYRCQIPTKVRRHHRSYDHWNRNLDQDDYNGGGHWHGCRLGNGVLECQLWRVGGWVLDQCWNLVHHGNMRYLHRDCFRYVILLLHEFDYTSCELTTSFCLGSGFTLASSKGSCGVVSGAISCASGVTASVFTVSTYTSLHVTYGVSLLADLFIDCEWLAGLQWCNDVLLDSRAHWVDPGYCVHGFKDLLCDFRVVSSLGRRFW